ncbi:MAG: hypothetical protein NVS2B12_06530 [Ktedonobacteraceae bacterium]
MKELLLTVFAVVFPNTPIIVIAIIVIAVIVIIGAVFVLRSGKSKKASATPAAGSADWQRQQPGQGAWNQQQQAGAPNSWGQPGQSGQPGQPAGNWGASTGQPGAWGAQQSNNPWGAANPAQGQQPDPWAAANPAQAQQSNNPWGAANPTQGQQPDPWAAANPVQAQQPDPWSATAGPQQQPNNPWSATASPAQAQQSNNPWGQQGGQVPWEAAPAAAPAAQDAWGQAQGGNAQPAWGQPGSSPMHQGQQAPNGYGANVSGAGWGQPQQQVDPWAAQQAGQGSQMPGGAQSGQAWQQGNMGQQGGFGQQNYGISDSDKTILRPNGAPQMGQTGQGYVRVEEGKEPGRIYEVRKESLSIGRSRESDIFLEDLAVSRLHASVVNMGNGQYVLKDEGSANGTKVNGQLVNKFQTYPLQEGDRVQLGQTVLVFGRK